MNKKNNLLRPETAIQLLLYFFMFILAAMPIVCKLRLSYPDDEKYYPFWNTALFAGFSYDVQLYAIKIYSLDGKDYKGGIDSFELRETLDGFGFSASTSILMMGRYLERGQQESFEKAKALFEQNYFRQDHYCLYSINKLSWNALNRWRNGKIDSEKELRRFEFRR